MASRRHVRVSSLILLLVVALVSAWGFTRCALFDRSLLTNTPCAPPCWYGIVPGETSEEEVIRILENLSFINPASIRVHSEPSRKITDIGWDYLPKLREADSGLIGIENGVVRKVLVLFYPPRSMKLSQLLEAQIPPEVAITDVNPDNSLSLTLVFPNKGFAVYCSGIYVGSHDVSVNASHKLRVLRYNRKLWIAGNEKAAYPSGWRNPRPAGCRRKDTLCWSVPQLMKKEQRRKCA